ncbi:hypothetical protein WH47_03313 [Habropoda laboriosa]|uniref:UBA domain-containing protein n=1 Tax=Habropoda laboriosa TaxID=597456 RepID=A0A0L7RBG2_9HYME|nr:hypothetical protein WH47_03313 [Habropoda laboriosa]
MDLCNGHCGLICDDSDEEDDSSPTNSPVSARRIVPSPPLPPRRPSPSPTPNSHSRNGRHLTVPKENAPPPPTSAVNSAFSSNIDNQQNNNINEAGYDMLHRASSPSTVPPVPPAPFAVVRGHVRRSQGNHVTASQPQPPPTLPEKSSRASSASSMTSSGQITSSNNVPPVPPPLSVPRPPKGSSGKEHNRQQDHHYENTIVIPGTRQHVVRNISLEANTARLSALMRGKEDPSGPAKPESAAYENVNVEHISKLTALGFAQDAVIRALGITRNDLEMACDILHEFATKSS